MRSFIPRIISSLLMLIPVAATAESTISQPVAQIQYDGVAGHLWLSGPAKWGAPSCANATFIRITGDVPGVKQLLAIALTAKASEQRLQFSGSCHTDPDYFNASYVFVN